ncbi:MAG: TonB-dependent receptor, partial [Cytophagaceae bacterium]|nr:TonB-dependent receptor [Gemmatimonadaceae bacterium]
MSRKFSFTAVHILRAITATLAIAGTSTSLWADEPAHSAIAAAPAIVGTVRDSAGVPLPNVQVVITSLNRVTSTDPKGTFVFRGLPPGRYHLDAVLLGYARSEAEVVVPADGDDVRADIVMKTTAVRLSNVTVSASPVGGDALGITQATIDLSGKELARNLGTSVAQTLANEPGMAMRYNGPAANIPVIRGLTGERILVLQDGDRSGDLSAPSADHGLTIDPLAANRIEVVRGPASLLYGTSALGGVVNVVSNDIPTTVPTHVAGYFAGMGESVNPGGAVSGSIAFPIGRALALQVGGGIRNSGDTYQGGGERLFNSESRNNNQVVGLGYIGEKGSAGVAFRRYDFRYGLPSTADDAEAGAKLDGVRNDLRGRAEFGGAGAFRLFRVDGSMQTYTHDEIESTGEVATSFDLKTQTLNGVVKTLFGAVNGALGVNGLFKQYAATGEEALTPAANSNSAGVFLFQDIPLRAGTGEHVPRLQAGARYDLFRIESKVGDAKFGPAKARDFNTFSGSLGLTLPLGASSSLGFSAARAFRAPGVEELFSNALHAATGFFEVGDANLQEEINQGIDGVFRVQSGKVDAQVSGYFSTIGNYIFTEFVRDTLVDG